MCTEGKSRSQTKRQHLPCHAQRTLKNQHAMCPYERFQCLGNTGDPWRVFLTRHTGIPEKTCMCVPGEALSLTDINSFPSINPDCANKQIRQMHIFELWVLLLLQNLNIRVCSSANLACANLQRLRIFRWLIIGKQTKVTG